MDWRNELASLQERLSATEALRKLAEAQEEKFRLKPFAEQDSDKGALAIAEAYHDLVWKGFPASFNSRHPRTYHLFKSAKPPLNKVTFPDFAPEALLIEIISGLIQLEEAWKVEIGRLRQNHRWWKRARRGWQGFMKRNPHFLMIASIVVVVAIGVVTIVVTRK